MDSDTKCNPVDSIGSSTESRISHSEPRLLLGFEGTKTARREGISSQFCWREGLHFASEFKPADHVIEADNDTAEIVDPSAVGNGEPEGPAAAWTQAAALARPGIHSGLTKRESSYTRFPVALAKGHVLESSRGGGVVTARMWRGELPG